MIEALTPATIAPHLQTRWLGRTLHSFAELDSTNTTARELAAAGAADGTVVIADAQRAGRGRLGRSWASPAGKNLYLSAVLRCAMPAERLAQISLLAGVAVCETAREWCAAEIKWPNDVLSDGRKVAGILAEMDSTETGHVVLLGIGVNLNATVDDFPEELRDKAGSLRVARGTSIDRARFTGRLLNNLEVRYEQWRRDGFAPIAARWRSLTLLIGRNIRVQEPGAVVDGTVLDMDADGALRLRLADGREHRVLAGDVTVIGGYPTSV
jgi:BirA family transcriptional regulator, biotin operon repressor / biotin---[acetyl-CoA-carboxylase] ligase